MKALKRSKGSTSPRICGPTIPSPCPQTVRGNKRETWYYEFRRHLEFYHHSENGVVAMFRVPWWMIERSHERCRPNVRHDRQEGGTDVH
jgi:hypothetical protein